MDYKIHIATAGEMWDQIALKYYGDEMKASFLLANNQELTDILIFEGGEKVRIPIIQESELITSLPPWRR